MTQHCNYLAITSQNNKFWIGSVFLVHIWSNPMTGPIVMFEGLKVKRRRTRPGRRRKTRTERETWESERLKTHAHDHALPPRLPHEHRNATRKPREDGRFHFDSIEISREKRESDPRSQRFSGSSPGRSNNSLPPPPLRWSQIESITTLWNRSHMQWDFCFILIDLNAPLGFGLRHSAAFNLGEVQFSCLCVCVFPRAYTPFFCPYFLRCVRVRLLDSSFAWFSGALWHFSHGSLRLWLLVLSRKCFPGGNPVRWFKGFGRLIFVMVLI